jgi:hypothetical protein
MTCEECEETLLDSDNCASRRNWIPGVSILNLARLHATNCPACSAKMSKISKVNAVLDQLRLAMQATEVPAAIEANLLVEFRLRRPRPTPLVPRGFPWPLVEGAAVALALVATLVFYPVHGERSSLTAGMDTTQRFVRRPAPSPQRLRATRDRTVENHQAAAGRQRFVSSSRELRSSPVGRAPERMPGNPELPLREWLSLNGGGNVVRVTLPMASLVAVGVPMNPEVSDQRITADVARDPFGAVIAIHLVETTPKN